MVHILVMPQFRFFVSNQQTRVRYPRNFNLAGADQARRVALRIARAFSEAVPYWKTLTADQQNDFVVEVVDGADQTVLTVPFRDVEAPEETQVLDEQGL